MILINVLFGLIRLHASFDIIEMIIQHGDHAIHVEVMDGMGVILIGDGVALEERCGLRELAGHLDRINRHWEAAIDHHCHGQGLLLLLPLLPLLVFGLFVEMCIACIEMPNHIIYTKGLERPLLGLSVLFLLLCVSAMVVYTWRMLTQKKRRPTPDIPQ